MTSENNGPVSDSPSGLRAARQQRSGGGAIARAASWACLEAGPQRPRFVDSGAKKMRKEGPLGLLWARIQEECGGVGAAQHHKETPATGQGAVARAVRGGRRRALLEHARDAANGRQLLHACGCCLCYRARLEQSALSVCRWQSRRGTGPIHLGAGVMPMALRRAGSRPCAGQWQRMFQTHQQASGMPMALRRTSSRPCAGQWQRMFQTHQQNMGSDVCVNGRYWFNRPHKRHTPGAPEGDDGFGTTTAQRPSPRECRDGDRASPPIQITQCVAAK